MSMQHDLQTQLTEKYSDKGLRVKYMQADSYHVFEVILTGRKSTTFTINKTFGSYRQVLNAAVDMASMNLDQLLRTKTRR